MESSAVHNPIVVGGVIILFFVGFVTATKRHQTPLKLRESLLVGVFLGGLVVLGSMQRWWVAPLLAGIDYYSKCSKSCGQLHYFAKFWF